MPRRFKDAAGVEWEVSSIKPAESFAPDGVRQINLTPLLEFRAGAERRVGTGPLNWLKTSEEQLRRALDAARPEQE